LIQDTSSTEPAVEEDEIEDEQVSFIKGIMFG
jgi:hypothetical protein